MVNKLYHRVILLVVAVIMLGGGIAMAADNLEFPLRAKYPDLTPIETEELAAIFADSIIVDSRNHAEYNVVHMKGAQNILVGKMQEDDLLALRAKDDATPLVFYCNGTTCSKSYKAAHKAVGWSFTNVKVYDPGIFYWAQHQPQYAEFFGKQMTAESVKTDFISKDDFERVNLSTADFLAKVNSGKYTVIDIRDPNERSEAPIRIPKMKVLSFDLLVSFLEKQSKAVPRSSLLILDNVGKQVDWLQYYLVKEGVTDYYFLKKGVLQWQKDGYDQSGKK